MEVAFALWPIRSQGHRLVLAISSIFALKNLCFTALVALQKVLQFSGVLSSQYWRSVSVHVSFHHGSDQWVIHFSVALSNQALEKTSATACAIMSTSAIVIGALRWMPQIPPISCSTNCVSVSLLFAIDTFLKSLSSEDSENEVFTLPYGFRVECVGVLVLLVECVGVLVNLQSRIQVW